MMRGRIVALLTLTLGIGTTAAHAQDTAMAASIRGISDRLTVSFGGFYADDAQARARNSNGWFLLSLSYDLLPLHPSRVFSLAVYGEGGGGNGRTRIARQEYRSFSRSFMGAGLSTTIRLTPRSRHFSMYGLASAGGYSLSRQESNIYQYIDYNPFGEDTQQEIVDPLSHRDRFSFGYKLGGGFRFGRGLFLEAAYYHLGRLEDTRYSGVGMTFGARL